MQKNDKSYTFLLSHSNRSRVFIKRIEVSKVFLRNGLLSLGLISIVSIGSIGVYAIFNNSGSLAAVAASGIPVQNQLSADQSKPNSFDYSRPGDSDDLSINSGGPFDQNDGESDQADMERRLKAIQAASNPANVPTMWAHLGKINNEFGFRRNPFGGRTYEFHAGMDIDGERGDIVIAPAGGVVTEAGWKGGYGQMVEIDHGNGLKTRFGHLSKIEVNMGDTLTRGQLIAFVGSTGRSTGPHLHFEVLRNGRAVDPMSFVRE